MGKSEDCKQKSGNWSISDILEEINNAPSKVNIPIIKLRNLLCKNVVEFLVNFSTQINSDFILFGEDENSIDPWSETYILNISNILKNKNIDNQSSLYYSKKTHTKEEETRINRRKETIKIISKQQKNFIKQIYKIMDIHDSKFNN